MTNPRPTGDRSRENRWRRRLYAAGAFLLTYLAIAYLALPLLWRTAIHEEPELAGGPHITHTADGHPGDPINIALVGSEADVIHAMIKARWYPANPITFESSMRIAVDTVLRRPDDEAPVSPLYLFGRSQDFALQRIRESINERLHLRLWMTELRYDGKPVWVGQVSRDIGVRFTLKTWNLTTHRIDPDVDESRDYVLEDLIEAERVEKIGYVPGVGECSGMAPRRNLTGDPYFTDGNRGIAIISGSRTQPTFLEPPVRELAHA